MKITLTRELASPNYAMVMFREIMQEVKLEDSIVSNHSGVLTPQTQENADDNKRFREENP